VSKNPKDKTKNHSNPANPGSFREWNEYILPQNVPNIIFDSDEMSMLLNSLPNLKATGPDGIPYEFFKIYHDLLAPILTKTFSFWFINPATIPFDFRTGFVSPIPKPKSDDFRLISLINTDRKIFTKLLSNHLFKHIKFSDFQIGFRPGLWINENILIFNELFIGNNAFIELLDFKNAFDSVDFKWIDYVLQKSLSPIWYSVLMSCIGGISYIDYDPNSPIELESGVRQGDCISSLLFNICINPLVLRISKAVVGVPLLGTNISTLAYADDITLFALSSRDHKLSWDIVRKFCSVSGLNVNETKSLSVGKKKSHLPHANNFKYLGISYNNDAIDWSFLKSKLISKYQFYQGFIKRFYTWPRVSLFNALLASNLVFYLRSFIGPPSLIKAYKNIVSKCFPRISYDRLIASKDSGGFGLMDIEVHNRNWLASWRYYMINRFRSNNNSIYLTLCNNLSNLHNSSFPIILCWYKLKLDKIKLFTLENHIFHWISFKCSVLFSFGDNSKWDKFWTWEVDDKTIGPFTDISQCRRLIWDILPAVGNDLFLFIKSFTIKRSKNTFPIDTYKKFKLFPSKQYVLTQSQIRRYTCPKYLCERITCILKSKAILKAKWWALDQIHNTSGLAINNEKCFICGKTIESEHFLNNCSPPDTASFPDYFTDLDISWCLYLSHLHHKFPDYHSTYNMLSDFNLL
jgi:hypothetical protein